MENRVLLLLLILCATMWHATGDTLCNKLLRELANEQSHFIYCSTSHAVPVPPKDERLCVGCKLQNDEMTTKYDELMKNCSKEYNDADRMNIVLTTQTLLKELWNKAFCDNCFINNQQTLGNFTELATEFNDCLVDHKQNECTSCVLNYINMNNFYKDLEKHNNGKICFDMQDIMNRTRVHWSTELKCCQREVQMQLFLICVAVVAVLPIVFFYSTVIVLTKRREANHGLLNDQEPALDTAPSTSQLITAAVLATPSVRTEVIDCKTEKIAKLITLSNDSNSSSDDDETPVLKPKNKQNSQLVAVSDSSDDDEPALKPKTN